MDRSDLFRIAGAASCDPRTVQSYIDGKAVREMVATRIEAAAKALKIKLPKRFAR